MVLSKKEAIREIEKVFDLVIKEVPMFKDMAIALKDTVLLIVKNIGTE